MKNPIYSQEEDSVIETGFRRRSSQPCGSLLPRDWQLNAHFLGSQRSAWRRCHRRDAAFVEIIAAVPVRRPGTPGTAMRPSRRIIPSTGSTVEVVDGFPVGLVQDGAVRGATGLPGRSQFRSTQSVPVRSNQVLFN